MSQMNLEVLCWNVRGLNWRARRDTVREIIFATLCHIVCLQETKLSKIDQFTIAYLGGHRLDSYTYKPAGGLSGTRGGILLMWNTNHVTLNNVVIGEYHITAKVITQEMTNNFTLSVVYGPTGSNRKAKFLSELQNQKPQAGSQWLIQGDFNLIYKASDKNNNRLNLRLMNMFKQALTVLTYVRFTYKIENSLGAMKDATLLLLSLTEFLPMRNGNMLSVTTSCTSSPPHYLTIVRCCSPTNVDQGTLNPSNLRIVGRCSRDSRTQ